MNIFNYSTHTIKILQDEYYGGHPLFQIMQNGPHLSYLKCGAAGARTMIWLATSAAQFYLSEEIKIS